MVNFLQLTKSRLRQKILSYYFTNPTKRSKRNLPRVYKLFNDAQSRVVGIILNRISMKSDDYYYYHS